MNTIIATPLDVARENILYRLEKSLESIRRRDVEEATGASYAIAAVHYRWLALCELLLSADVDRFFGFLIKSGQARLTLLNAVNAGHEVQPVFVCTSRNTSFTDAVVAGALDLAASIADASPDTVFSEVEYEDDFLRQRFFYALCLNDFRERRLDLGAILARWGELIVETDYYYDVAVAIVDRDAFAFAEAFSELVAHRIEKVAESRKDFAVNPEIPLVTGSVYLTGAAILRLAALHGVEIDDQYDSIPDFVRAEGAVPSLSPESWRDIEADMGGTR